MSKPKRHRMTSKGYLGLLVGLLGALYIVNRSGASSQAEQQPAPTPTFSPTERINVEQSVDFPRDI